MLTVEVGMKDNSFVNMWIDESGTPNVSAESDEFAVGMLISTVPITGEMIDEALQKLSEDPEIADNKQDERTLSERFFHASEDSKNGHWYICEVAQTVSPAFFEHILFKKEYRGDDHEWMTATESRFHQHMVEILCVHVSASRRTRYKVYVAERKRTFPKGIEKEWLRGFENKMLGSLSMLPQLPLAFPKVDIEIVPATNPGVQVVDFLLWSSMRMETLGEEKWLATSGYKHRSGWGQDDGPLFSKKYISGGGIEEEPPIVKKDLLRAPRTVATEEMCDLLLRAELAAKRAVKSLPEHASHLQDRVLEKLDPMRSLEVIDSDLQGFAEAYLYLVDTVPLYNAESKKEVVFSIDTKNLLGIIWMGREPQWTAMVDVWRRYREEIHRLNPTLLELD
jgi:hypothetical protein